MSETNVGFVSSIPTRDYNGNWASELGPMKSSVVPIPKTFPTPVSCRRTRSQQRVWFSFGKASRSFDSKHLREGKGSRAGKVRDWWKEEREVNRRTVLGWACTRCRNSLQYDQESRVRYRDLHRVLRTHVLERKEAKERRTNSPS
jgi:hypothetical protein